MLPDFSLPIQENRKRQQKRNKRKKLAAQMALGSDRVCSLEALPGSGPVITDGPVVSSATSGQVIITAAADANMAASVFDFDGVTSEDFRKIPVVSLKIYLVKDTWLQDTIFWACGDSLKRTLYYSH